MRFFGAPGFVLALGVSAVAGHSYHGFEHGYQPVESYGGLPEHQDYIHEGHIVIPYDIHSEVPEFHEDFHPNHGDVSYLEPLDLEHHDLVNHDDQSHHELHDFGHQGNYVLHDHNEHHINFGHNEKPAYHDTENHHEHHEHHENYVLHGNEEHHKKDHKKSHKKEHKKEHHSHDQKYHKEHEEHSHEHDDEHKSEAKYSFKYGVNDPKTGDVKEQWESRTGDKVKGGYALKESDGTTRVVHYSADKKKGFQATVHKIGHPKVKHSEHGHKGHHDH